MFDVTVCMQSSACCINATPVVSENPVSSPPTRVFIGVGRSCDDDPPISSPTGSASAPWVEATSISSVGGGDYQVTFPGIVASDPRCVTPCSANYSVCIWTLHADGTTSCDERTFDPGAHCTELTQGCPECANDELP